MFHWFGHKIHYHLKGCMLYRKNHSGCLFQNRNADTGPLFKKTPEILKFVDKVDLDNWILISKPLHKTLLKILCDWFTLSFESHTYNIRWANKCSFPLYQILWQILLL